MIKITANAKPATVVAEVKLPGAIDASSGYPIVKGDKGDQGPPGPKGDPGPAGASATIAIGAVTTGEAGSSATVTNSGTSSAAVFDFTIPKGDKGDTGATGADGQDGAAATVAVGNTSTGEAGTSASVTNSGTSSAAVFDFVIPKGDKGDTGPAGTTDYNDLTNKPTIPSTAAEVNALPDTTKYALSTSVGGSAKNSEGIPYGIVDGTSTSTAFTATVAGITELKDGTVVMLKNGVVTSASGFTIDINNLGAKPVYSNMAAATAETTIFNINYTMLFVYDSTRVAGGAWIAYRGYYSDSNSIGYQIRYESGALPASDKFYRYRLLFESADGTKWVPANTSSSTNATAVRTTNTRPINPFGRIAYFSNSGSVEANASVAASYAWAQYALALGYSFNTTGAALTLTYPAPVYLKCTPQSDGSAVMDSITQTLPSSEDGKIYIFLGIAYSATQINLMVNHPVYYYKDSQIRLWTNPTSGSAPDVYWCTYGTTSVADIDAALAADQLPCCLKDDVMYVYGWAVDDKRYFGSTVLDSKNYMYLMNNNGTWSKGTMPMHGLPSGGTAAQFLRKSSVVDYDVAWESVTIPELAPAGGSSPSTDVQYGSIGSSTYAAHADHRHPTKFPTTGTPKDLGTAANGTADTYAHSDHVHQSRTGTTFEINSTNIESDVEPAEAQYGNAISFTDANNDPLGEIYLSQFAGSGIYQYLNLRAVRDVSGSEIGNLLRLGIDTNGDPLVSMSSPAAWLTALGLGVSKEETASNVISAGTSVSVTSAQRIIWGHVCQLRFVVKPSANRSAGATIATIVGGSDYYPWITTVFHGTSGNVHGYISSSGEIVTNTSLSSGTSYTLGAIFLI